jgi:lipopolysaccharide export system permease protein
LSSPLLCPALALIAAAFLLIGDFNRRGYTKRLVMASIAALLLRVLTLGVQSAAREEASLNVVQYILPLLVAVGAAAVIVFFQRSAKAAPRAARFEPAAA